MASTGEIQLPENLERSYEQGIISMAQACEFADIKLEMTPVPPPPTVAPTEQRTIPLPDLRTLTPRERLLADQGPAHELYNRWP